MKTMYSALRYWCAHHPVVADFRWDHNAWGSSWLFLTLSILTYLAMTQMVKLVMNRCKRPVPLGALPALYRLTLALASLVMFVGCAQSAWVEMEETRWLWRTRSKTRLGWLACFPVGTRPAGRVFFWTYTFYLTKLYELLDTFIILLRKRKLTATRVSRNATTLISCFLWLQFSHSLQVLMLLAHTGTYIVSFSFSFYTGVRVPFLPRYTRRTWVRLCKFARLGFMAVASLAFVGIHLRTGGCSGMGAWIVTLVIDFITWPFVAFLDRKTPKVVVLELDAQQQQQQQQQHRKCGVIAKQE